MGSRSLTRFRDENHKIIVNIYVHNNAREVGFTLKHNLDWDREICNLAAEAVAELLERYHDVALLPFDVVPLDIEWIYDVYEEFGGKTLHVVSRGISIGRALGPEKLIFVGHPNEYEDEEEREQR